MEAASEGATERGLADAVSGFAGELAISKGNGADFRTAMAKLAARFNGDPDVPGTATADSLSGALNEFFSGSGQSGSSASLDADPKYFSSSLEWVSQG